MRIHFVACTRAILLLCFCSALVAHAQTVKVTSAKTGKPSKSKTASAKPQAVQGVTQLTAESQLTPGLVVADYPEPADCSVPLATVVTTNGGNTLTITDGNATLLRLLQSPPATGCQANANFGAGDEVLWTGSDNPATNNPITINFATGVTEFGVQAIGVNSNPGNFNASFSFQVFNGVTSLGTFTVTGLVKIAAGDDTAPFLGARATGADVITRVVITHTAGGTIGNFMINQVKFPGAAVVAATTPLIISELRTRGPNGANDEFVEVYNRSGAAHTVADTNGAGGYAIAASDGVVRCLIPNGTIIPAGGHYLCVNSVGYSLASYPAGNGTTATGDATFTTDIPDNAGIGLFSTGSAPSFTLANRFDAVGSTSEANTLYKEGTGYPALTPFSIDYSFFRDMAITGVPKDTDNNAADFLFADTAATSAGAGQRLGAPGPENLSSPINRGATIKSSLIDPGCTGPGPVNGSGAPTTVNACERQRDSTADAANPFGTLSIRRKFTNNTGAAVTRLRFRIVDITTLPSASTPGTADVRARTSATYTANLSGGGTTPVGGLTLETPPTQSIGGGWNSTLSTGAVALGTPLAAGASINLHFLLGIQTTGSFRFFVIVEALP